MFPTIRKVKIMIKFVQRVRMNDNVELSCDVYISSNVPAPAILFRTPYGKEDMKMVQNALAFQRRGFNFVSCDVRGRGDSEGKFIPYMNEGDDGTTLIQWCSKQPWCDGNVFTWGASYSARVQWLTALRKPEALKGMISIVSPSDPFVENPTCTPSPTYISWLFSISGHVMQNVKLVNMKSVYESLPFIKLDEQTGRNIPFWKEIVRNEPGNSFWDPLFYQKKMNTLDLPVMHISGWYDDEQIGTFINYNEMKEVSMSSFSRDSQKIIIGPWPHDVNITEVLGKLNFGKDSLLDLVNEECKWIDNIISKRREDSHAKIFIMGINRWFDFKQWPLENTYTVKYFLDSHGSANGKYGDGLLSTVIPQYKERNDSFSYDPMNPVPYLGTDTFNQMGGPDDYSEIEKRKDVLVYTTEAFKKELIILGKVKAHLFVETSTPDTDFTVKLLDVWPDGYAQRLLDNICRLSHRDGPEVRYEHSENRKIHIEFDLWNTGHLVKPDHRLRVEISSSAFPKYARNQNISGIQWNTANFAVAHQKVYHGSDFPSRICLSTIKRENIM